MIKKAIALALMTAGMVFASHGLAAAATTPTCPSLQGYRVVGEYWSNNDVMYAVILKSGIWPGGIIYTNPCATNECSKQLAQKAITSGKPTGTPIKEYVTDPVSGNYFWACKDYTNLPSGAEVITMSISYTPDGTPAKKDHSVQQKMEMLRGR